MAGDATEPALWQALTSASAYGLGADTGRTLTTGAEGAALVLRRLADTMLGRRLIFAFDGAERLRCDAEMGRLLAFSTLDSSGAASAPNGFENRDDSAAIENAAAAFEETLAGLCSRASDISVRSEALVAGGTSTRAGFPVERLLARLQSADAEDEPAARLRRFLDKAQDLIASAVIVQGDTVDPVKGPEADAGALFRVSSDLLSRMNAPEGAAGAPTRWRLLIVAGVGQVQNDVLVAEIDDHLLLATARASAMPALRALWLDALGTAARPRA
ncbi:hypothetical protein [Jannaschia seohaensis]|uniref:Uncharacterized protein n=1 Tax=Jannaschia seohaensis TaxID=475081 RepID=A0A2Y9AUU4_9RHOB|nr:hypothetical protein [Jannaschia seohaensis]PWJ19337.1 hypothetical protein BCF38_104273 [Jannaschia seohaensis]SSA45999.1 hypothetical protein SAMN05421539_104273 [Jannaschia seohaensis]